MKYADSDEVIRRANGTTYGLGASVWSSNTKRAHDVARWANVSKGARPAADCRPTACELFK